MGLHEITDINSVLELVTLFITGLYIALAAASMAGIEIGSSKYFSGYFSGRRGSFEAGSFEVGGLFSAHSMVRYLLPVTLCSRFEVGSLISVSRRSLFAPAWRRRRSAVSHRQYLSTKVA